MSSITELKLLTLLNVTAIKRPRELDLPGGHRASPSTSRRESLSLSLSASAQPQLSRHAEEGGEGVEGVEAESEGTGEGRQKKRRKSVVFGGEVGPSGSTYGNKAKKEKGKGKGKGKEEANGGEGAINGIVSNGHAGEVGSTGLDGLAAGEGSDEEGETSAGWYRASEPCSFHTQTADTAASPR